MKKDLFLVVIMLASLFASTFAQDYPSKPIEVFIPFRAGGGTDTLGRVFAAELEAALGTPVNVSNPTGGGGTAAMQRLALTEADGHTLAVTVSEAITTNPLLQDLTIQPQDFDFLGTVSTYQSALVANSNAPYDNLDEFVAYAKENPGLKYMYLGAVNRQLVENLAAEHGLEIDYLIGQGGADIIQPLLNEELDLAFSGGIHVRNLTGDGPTLKVIAATGTQRLVATPDVLTLAEAGYEGELEITMMVVAPAGLPDDVKATLAAAVKAVTESDAFIAAADNLKFPVSYVSAEETAAMSQAAYDNLVELLGQ